MASGHNVPETVDETDPQIDGAGSPWVLLRGLNSTEQPNQCHQTEIDYNQQNHEIEVVAVDHETIEENTKKLMYGVEERPPIYLTVVFGLQNLLLGISGCISVPLIVCTVICAAHLPLVKAQIIGTFLVMCGISTILQCVIGVRLPILQGGSSSFIPPIVAMMNLDEWACPAVNATPTDVFNQSAFMNNGSDADYDDYWKIPLREIQGGIMLASLTQVVIGAFGLIGPLLRVIGPLTVTPCVALIGLALTHICIKLCSKQWGIAILTMSLLFIFSLYLSNVRVPLRVYSKKRGWHTVRSPVFKLLPVILAISISWLLCIILEVSGVLGTDPEGPGAGARTNVRAIEEAVWLFFPYPGQWGMPTVSAASYVAMLCATVASIVESIGDYYACAKACHMSQPPPHAVNRGIMIEGFSSVISGALGTGGASTSYSSNIGAIGITSVGSRAAFVMAGCLFILAGIFGKFGGLLAAMPEPIIGGTIVVGLSVVVSVALANLSYIDVNCSRNQTILGFSLMMGLMVPAYVAKSPIDTGIRELDQALSVMLGTPMFVGAALGCFLDNTVPGTDEERGLTAWRRHVTPGTSSGATIDDRQTYDIPYMNGILEKFPRLAWLPFVQDVKQ